MLSYVKNITVFFITYHPIKSRPESIKHCINTFKMYHTNVGKQSIRLQSVCLYNQIRIVYQIFTTGHCVLGSGTGRQYRQLVQKRCKWSCMVISSYPIFQVRGYIEGKNDIYITHTKWCIGYSNYLRGPLRRHWENWSTTIIFTGS